MELTFVKAEESGWRGRGAPRRTVPQDVLDLLTRTLNSGEVGILDTRGSADSEIREALADLRAGARQLHRNIRIQHDADNSRIRFQLGASR